VLAHERLIQINAPVARPRNLLAVAAHTLDVNFGNEKLLLVAACLTDNGTGRIYDHAAAEMIALSFLADPIGGDDIDAVFIGA